MTKPTELHLSQDRTIAQALVSAVSCQRAGRAAEAEQLYLAVLQAVPEHPDANHNMGVLRVRANDAEAGLPYLLTAIEADATVSLYWLSYIEALQLAERPDDARAVLAHARQQGLQGKEADALMEKLQPKKSFG